MTDDEDSRLKARIVIQRQRINALSRSVQTLELAVHALHDLVKTRLEELRPKTVIMRPIEGVSDEVVMATLKKVAPR